MTALDRERRRPANERASKIRMGMRTYIDTLGLIHTAWAQRDDVTLGYPSWEAYYNAEFSEERVRLSPEMRDKAITELRIAGMSQREIAVSTGLSASTVNRHLNRVAGETDILEGDVVPPAESPVVGALKQAIVDVDTKTAGAGLGEPAPVPNHPGVTSDVPGDAESAGNTSGEEEPLVSVPRGSAAGAVTPAAPAAPEWPCEKCGSEMPQDVYDAGFTRCADCDPDGEHQICRPCGRPL